MIRSRLHNRSAMQRRALLVAGLLAVALLSLACNERDQRRLTGSYPNTGAYPMDIFTEMHYQQSFRSQETPRLDPPNGSVPTNALDLKDADEYASAQASAEPSLGRARLPDVYAALTSPITSDPQMTARGKELFRVNCAMCHNTNGEGAGKVPVGAPPLISDNAKGYVDGKIYGIISEGGNTGYSSESTYVMPKFRLLLTSEERWLIVNYMRTLQGK